MPDPIRIEQIMTKDVAHCAPDDPIGEVAGAMRDRNISCMVVCEERVPVGVISERDFVRVAAEVARGLRREPQVAADLMTSPVVTVPSSVTLDFLTDELKARQIRRLPVVDEPGNLVGLVTQTDVLNAYTGELERSVAERMRAMEEANHRFELLGVQDGLLKIGNRKGIELALTGLHAARVRDGRPYAVIVFDLAAADGSGRETRIEAPCDDVLRRVTTCMRDGLRCFDSLYRSGTGELLALLPDTDREVALQLAERVCAGVREAAIGNPREPSGVVTAHCGVAASEDTSETASHAVMEEAHRALVRQRRELQNG